MLIFEEGLFLLDIGLQLGSFEDIPHSLHRDRVVNSRVDVFGSICSILSLPIDDKADNPSLILWGELPRCPLSGSPCLNIAPV